MIAQTPPMGWNSWDCYGAAVDEPTVRQNAAYMAEHLQVFGWEYIVVDIQWYQPTATSHAYEPFAELTMDEYGRLQPAPGRFPSSAGGKGFKPLADYVHSLGLKFGIHIMRGMPRMAAHRHLPILGCGKGCHEVANPNSICAWNPDMYGLRCDMPEARAYYDSIFRMYAEWGVDFVKCDDIAREYPHCKREIEVISDACRACGRDIVLSLSPGPAPLEQAEHLKKYANMWRMSDTQLRQLITAHIDEDEFCRYVIQRDINGIALALRETHKDDFFSVPEDNPLKEMLETAGEIVSQDSDTEQAYLAFICKRLKLNFRKLSVEERKWLKKIAEKSDLLKNPKPQRGRR